MSSSICIPKRKKNPMTRGHPSIRASTSASTPTSSASSSLSLSSGTPQMNSHPSSSSSLKDEYVVRPSKAPCDHERPSLLSSSLSAQEHTVINVGHPDGPPRLITCVKASQGFDWNQDIFLPSHTHAHTHAHNSTHTTDYPDLERRKDPVHEIVLSDEELENMFPR